MSSVIGQHESRVYPPPTSPWILAMGWRDLLFMHWRVEASRLREFVPPGLTIQEHGGSAWLGVVPFEMVRTRARWMPPAPGVSRFPELNVRTYVRGERSGRPGVWFFSLDASRPLAVRAARRGFRLAYMDARMTIDRERDGWVRFESSRTGPHRALTVGKTRRDDVALRGRYRPTGEAMRALPGSLESFLTDRYCLYSWQGDPDGRRGRLFRGEIHHSPWPLQPAEAEIEANTMAEEIGVDVAALGPPLLHFARSMDVRAWWPVREALREPPTVSA